MTSRYLSVAACLLLLSACEPAANHQIRQTGGPKQTARIEPYTPPIPAMDAEKVKPQPPIAPKKKK